MKASLTHVTDSEEEQLKKALQLSALESEVELTPEERDYQEALRQSLLDNNVAPSKTVAAVKVSAKKESKTKEKEKPTEKKRPVTRSKAKK